LDEAGRPHIVYSAGDELRYASYDGAAWQVQVLDRQMFMAGHTSLVLDSSGHPHASYCYALTAGGQCAGLRYSYHDGNAWQHATVDTTGTADTSLALDAAGWPHIACGGPGGVRYVSYDGASWQTEVVDDTAMSLQDVSLALDAAGRPHISYFQWSDAASSSLLRYAHFDGVSWLTETVDSGPAVGLYNSLALDAAGRPHIAYSYTSGSDRNLKYASYDGTTWQLETVTTMWEGVSLALDSAGFPHLAYNDASVLKYAWYDGSAWQIEPVEALASLDRHIALVLDVFGHPHISYNSSVSPYPLRYAYHDGAAWRVQDVDSGRYSSLALAAADQPRIAYLDPVNWQVEYARGTHVPVSAVQIGGPAGLSLGITALYSATYAPPSATLPVTITWDNGSLGPSTAYSWTVTGTHVVAVTATNAFGQAQDALTVSVFYQPLQGAAIAGPQGVLVSQTATYQAIPEPITASLPITFTWDNGTAGPTAAYSWTLTGTYTLTVTATGRLGEVQVASLPVQVWTEWPYRIYLPWVCRYCGVGQGPGW
jgi:hypothetical protein